MVPGDVRAAGEDEGPVEQLLCNTVLVSDIVEI
jgi:hypothetical protein